MKKNKLLIKHIVRVSILVLVIFFASQCFAESYTGKSSRVANYKYSRNINSVFDFVQQNYVDEIDPQILYEGALKGMLDAIGDPYTLYLDDDSMRDLTDTTAGNFGGVGLQISKAFESTPEKPAYVEVATPIEGTPGYKAGIVSGDKIIAIEGLPTDEMSMNDVLSHLRGEVGGSVTITILRGKSIVFDVTLVRELIEVPTVKYGMIDNTSIGYARLIQFTPDTAIRLQEALNAFEEAGYTGLIIDLRDNPGGLLDSAIQVSDKFIDEGPIVTTKSRLFYENQQFSAIKENTTVSSDIPIVVLINRGSASASEILSGALKDYHRAYLVGERTYGKGSVQQLIPLSASEGIKMTVARYYTPSDSNIDKIGIPPDLEVKNVEEFTKDREKQYVNFLESNIIMETVDKNPDMTEKDIAEAAAEIAETYPFEERLIRRMLRIQVERHKEAPLYDMDFDLQLHAAIKVLEEGNFNELVQNTKTLKELQEEAKAEEALEE